MNLYKPGKLSLFVAIMVLCLLTGTVGIFKMGLVASALADEPAFTAIAAGNNHSLAVRNDGTVWAWGYNNCGQLGDGTTFNGTSPVQVQGLTGIIAIAAGREHSLVVKNDGTVWAWGSNEDGQLGDGTYSSPTGAVQVKGLNNVTAVAAGNSHSLALKSDGTVWAWGYNYRSQLGDGTTSTSATAVQAQGLSNISSIAARSDHNIAVKNDGTVWTWGDNSYGQLGDGTYNYRSTPVQVLGADGTGFLTGVSTVSTGGGYDVAVKNDGTVWAWGSNRYDQLGYGTPGAVQVQVLDNVTAIAAGYYHSLALKSDGTVWAWGYNGYGQLGDGTTNFKQIAVQVPGLSTVTAIAAGGNHSLVLKQDATVWSCGDNELGQLGDATISNRNSLVQVQFGLEVDNSAPEVISCNPANNATAVPLNTTITVKFSEVVQQGNSFGLISLKDEANNNISLKTKILSGDTLTIEALNDLVFGKTYTVKIPAHAVKDMVNNSLVNEFSFSFVAGAEVKVTGVTLNRETLTLGLGTSPFTLLASVAPANASNKNVTWTSSHPTVATVDNLGVVTAVSTGSTMITATTEDGLFTANCTVNVSVLVPVSGVILDNSSLELGLGQSANLTATVLPMDASNIKVNWTTDNPKVATVDANGKISAISAGTANITVTTEDGAFAASCSCTVTDQVITFPDANLEMLIRGKVGKISGDILNSDVLKISSLAGYHQNIASLQGVQTLSNLTSLDLWSNHIIDISPLSSLGKLETLDLSGNEISDISVLENVHSLKSLILSRNRVNDISPLSSLISLTNLDLAYNQISDISSISGLTNLIGVNLEYNLISNISPLVTNSNNGGLKSGSRVWLSYNLLDVRQGSQSISDLQSLTAKGVSVSYTPQRTLVPVTQVTLNKSKISLTPGTSENLSANISPSTATNQNVTWSSSDVNIATVNQDGKVNAVAPGTATIKVITDDGGFDAGCSVEVYTDSVINIPDATLRSIIRQKINKITGDILKSDVLSITDLNVDYQGISDFEGLGYLSNLTYLSLRGNQIQELDFLTGMSNLTNLYLEYNQIRDISALTDLSSLSNLSLRQNQIENVSVFASLSNLTNLDLANNQINEISSLADLTKLRKLYLQDNKIRDISALVTNSNNGGFSAGTYAWDRSEINLINNYLDINENSQNALDIQSLLDKMVLVQYFPQRVVPPEVEAIQAGTVSVVIDNCVNARPQKGLDKADIVYETAVAPGISRFLAVFDLNKSIGEIGPVRSARRQLVELAAGHRGAFAHCGGSNDALNIIPSVPMMNFDELYGSGAYFYRAPEKNAPHNLYTNKDLLLKGVQDRGGDVGSSKVGLPVGEMTGGSSAEQATVRFYGQSQDTVFSWDATTAKYTRSVNGQDTRTADDIVIRADNVIIMFAPHKQYYSTEAGEWVVSAEFTGTGTARFYRDGKVLEGRWQKASISSPATFSVNNSPMQFKPGNTWVMVDEALAINSIEPVNGQNNVSVNSGIVIEFTLPFVPGTNYDNIALKDEFANTMVINKSIHGKKLIIDPLVDLANKTTYTVSIPVGALTDNRGNSLAHEFVSSFTTRGEYDLSLTLGKGWSLISLPRKAEVFEIPEEDIEAWLSYAVKGEKLLWLSDQNDINNELNNPASAVYIKTLRPTVLRFRWKAEDNPQDMFAAKKLSAGWNLIGTGARTNLKNIFSSLRYENGSGLTQVFAPNLFNQNKQNGYYLNWSSPLLDITDWGANNIMCPFDGYWVFLRGLDRDYSTVIDLSSASLPPFGLNADGGGSGGSISLPTAAN